MIHPFFLLLFFVLLYTAVLYKSGAALTLCVLFIFWFLASVFHVLYNLRKVQINFPFSAYTGKKEQQAIFTFTVKNTGFLPLSRVRLRLLLLDQSGKKVEDKRLFLSLGPKSRRKYSLTFSSPYSGRFHIQLKKFRIYSFFSLVSLTRKINLLGEAVFFPQPSPVPVKISEKTRYFVPEGEDNLETPFLSPSAAGSFGEDIRSYRPQDSIKLVHWKLSARNGELLVRIPASEEGFLVLLFLDLAAPDQKDSARQISAFFQCAVSLSFSMLELKCSHLMIWFDQKEQCLRRFPVRNEEELNFAVYCLLHGDFYQSSQNLYSLYSREHPTDTWACRLLLDTGLNLWQEEKKLFSSSPETLEEDMALAEIIL